MVPPCPGRMCRWLALNNGCHTLVTTHGCLHRRACSEVKIFFLDESKFEYLDNDCQVTIIIAQKCPECSAGQDRRWRWRLVRTDHLGPRHLTPTGAGARVSAGSGHTLVTPPPHPGPGSCVTFALLMGTPSQFRSPINR